MGLRAMGLANEIVVIAFASIIGSAAIACALAFGLGGRDAAARVLDQWADQAGGPPMPPPRPKRLRQAPPPPEPDEGDSQPPLV
jgi:hypothetical protein